MAYRASRTARYCFLALAIVCSILGLVAICVSFTTDHWLHYEVNRSTLGGVDPTEFGYTQAQFDASFKEDSRFFSRERGMLRTCYIDDSDSITFTEVPDQNDVDEKCVRETGYDWDDPDIVSPVYEDDNFELRRHLMRSHLAFFIIGIICFILAIISSILGCVCIWFTAYIIASVCCLLGCIVILLGMVFFHWYKYLEENEIDFDEFGRKAWHQEPFLDQNTDVEYQYSYGLGWVALFFCLLAFLFFVLTAWSTRRRDEDEDRVVVVPEKTVYVQQPQQQQEEVYIVNHQPAAPAPQPIFVQAQPQPAPMMIQAQQPPPYMIQAQPMAAPSVMYDATPMQTGHTVFQSRALPPGVTSVFQ